MFDGCVLKDILLVHFSEEINGCSSHSVTTDCTLLLLPIRLSAPTELGLCTHQLYPLMQHLFNDFRACFCR
jgi:hypothetical protein